MRKLVIPVCAAAAIAAAVMMAQSNKGKPAENHDLGYSDTPVLAAGVLRAEQIMSLIHAGATDICLGRADSEQTCESVDRLLRSPPCLPHRQKGRGAPPGAAASLAATAPRHRLRSRTEVVS